MAMFSSFCSRRFSHVSGMSSEVVPWVEGPCARWPCPSIACWSRIVLRLEAIVQNIRWSRVARRLMQYQRSCWNFYCRAVGGDGNAPASTIWFRSPPRQVPHVEIPPPLDDEPPFSFYSEYLDSELEELAYY